MTQRTVIGLDIGGTKCGVIRADEQGRISEVRQFPTTTCRETLERMFAEIAKLQPGKSPLFGVSCGDPQDAKRGIILGPPNLPGWEHVPIKAMLEERFGGEAHLMNDANAGALAEWRFGAGRGTRSMVFITCGTGFGAGLVLDGRLYEGASGAAGEIGHVRLEPGGPVGYGKAGSVEGFCSGGGIAQLAQTAARRYFAERGTVPFGAGSIEKIATRDVGAAAERGDALAREVLTQSGRCLGRALAILVDILNPERIALGSVYVRCRAFLEPAMRETLAQEALPHALRACEVVPAELGENIGNVAAVTVALYRSNRLSG